MTRKLGYSLASLTLLASSFYFAFNQSGIATLACFVLAAIAKACADKVE